MVRVVRVRACVLASTCDVVLCVCMSGRAEVHVGIYTPAERTEDLFRVRFVLSVVLPPLPDFPIQLQERANHIRQRVQTTPLGFRLCVCGVFFMCMFVVCFGCTCVCVVCVCVCVSVNLEEFQRCSNKNAHT
jgi:hypothetical protein